MNPWTSNMSVKRLDAITFNRIGLYSVYSASPTTRIRIMKITKQIVSLFVLTAFVLSMFSLVGAQEKTAVSFKTVGGHTILPVQDLRPGMKGVALTVFSGSASEEFGVEIIGV